MTLGQYSATKSIRIGQACASEHTSFVQQSADNKYILETVFLNRKYLRLICVLQCSKRKKSKTMFHSFFFPRPSVIFMQYSWKKQNKKSKRIYFSNKPLWFQRQSHGRHTKIILEVGPDLWQGFLFVAAQARPGSAGPANSWYKQG